MKQPKDYDLPKCYQDFIPIDKLLMIPGPTNLSPKVLHSLSKPLISHTDPQFYQLLAQIQNGIRYLFQTNNRYSFAITGSATIAMETAICNLMQSGQLLLSLTHGYWGSRAASIGQRLGFRTKIVRNSDKSFGSNFTLEEIENLLKKYRPKLIYICQGDSSICCTQNLDGIGKLCHQYDCLLLVDAVVSLCTTAISMDRMEIDCVFSGCQKALSGPPGISIISFSDRAVDLIKSRHESNDQRLISSFYMDINLLAKAWGIDNNRNEFQYHYTPAINLLYGLHASILEIIAENLEKVIERHQMAKAFMEQCIENIGLKLLVSKPANRLAGITSVLIPDDIDGNQIIKAMYQDYNILIGGSLFKSSSDRMNVPKFWRIGYLGVNADHEKIRQTIDALHSVIEQQRNELFKAHL